MSIQKQTNSNNEDAINSFDSKNLAQILRVEQLILNSEKKIQKKQGFITQQNRFLNKIVIAAAGFSLLSIVITGFLVFQNQNNRDSEATAVNLISDVNIGDKTYLSQGSGEIIGDMLFTTAHNYSLDQINFLLQNGAKFDSPIGNCSKNIAGKKVQYYEGVIEVPLELLNGEMAVKNGIRYPQILQNNSNVYLDDSYLTYLNPEDVYIKGILKNQGTKKERLLTGEIMFSSNGSGLSGAAYKRNSDSTIADNEYKITAVEGFHVGSATLQGQKINIMWASNGDGTFSYARYLPNGKIKRVDNLLNIECNI
jgi:hypothetical protein